jgi:hypothetical protein
MEIFTLIMLTQKGSLLKPYAFFLVHFFDNGLIKGMTIWIVALVLLVFCALLGHKQGAIRAAISCVGILISGLLAWPLSGLVARLMTVVIHHPIAVWTLSPIIAFVILMVIFKWIGFTVHRKIWVHYQYLRDETKTVLWQRLNRRTGLGIGLINALLYIILISVPIYNFSYWTLQIAPSDQEKFEVRLLNRMGQDLAATGMAKVACAIDPLPNKYFKSADLAGLIYQNSQLAERLAAYPPFLPLAERDDFRALAQDPDFRSAWEEHGPFEEIWDNAQFSVLRQDRTTANLVWNLLEANLDDLTTYLNTGVSAKYDSEPILGRWDVNVLASLHKLFAGRPNVPSTEMAEMRALWTPAYSNTVFVAAPDNEAFLENFPQFTMKPNVPPTFASVNLQGSWQSGDTYNVTLAGDSVNKSGTGTIGDAGLTLKLGSDTLVLEHEQQ